MFIQSRIGSIHPRGFQGYLLPCKHCGVSSPDSRAPSCKSVRTQRRATHWDMHPGSWLPRTIGIRWFKESVRTLRVGGASWLWKVELSWVLNHRWRTTIEVVPSLREDRTPIRHVCLGSIALVLLLNNFKFYVS